MPICAILLAKPSMQVLYERVLRRPYPRSQRHVYIGMSRTSSTSNQPAFLSFFPLHSSFLLVEKHHVLSMSHFSETLYLNCCHAILYIYTQIFLSIFIIRPWPKSLIEFVVTLWSCHIKHFLTPVLSNTTSLFCLYYRLF